MGYFPAFDLLLNKNAPEARRFAQKKRPAHFQSGKKQQKRPLPMALPTGAHSNKKRPTRKEQGEFLALC